MVEIEISNGYTTYVYVGEVHYSEKQKSYKNDQKLFFSFVYPLIAGWSYLSSSSKAKGKKIIITHIL